MLSFRSEVFPDFFSEKFGYHTKNMLIGSCFTEHIGKKLTDLKFPVIVNPFGILYNPVSVAQSLNNILKLKHFKEKDLFFFNEKWISFSHHGRFSSANSSDVVTSINYEIGQAADYLNNSSILFITFGTSWVYKYKKTNQVVANCHKIPAAEFDHYLLSINEIVQLYSDLFEEIHKRNEKLRIVFTLSPVRHWKDGVVNNQYSKSILIVAIQELIKKFVFVSYFPSYEIFMDDLRDYRFYADDLFHPNQVGIDYVWEKFRACFINPNALIIAEKVEKILKATAHRPFYPTTRAYLKFLDNNLKAINQFKSEFPEMNFKEEIKYFISEKEKYFGSI
jgi:hypothetical protein